MQNISNLRFLCLLGKIGYIIKLQAWIACRTRWGEKKEGGFSSGQLVVGLMLNHVELLNLLIWSPYMGLVASGKHGDCALCTHQGSYFKLTWRENCNKGKAGHAWSSKLVISQEKNLISWFLSLESLCWPCGPFNHAQTHHFFFNLINSMIHYSFSFWNSKHKIPLL